MYFCVNSCETYLFEPIQTFHLFCDYNLNAFYDWVFAIAAKFANVDLNVASINNYVGRIKKRF